MDFYLPIAEMSVNAWVIITLGGLVGFLSGMFGVGGGFLTTPLLIFYGIPPAVAVASSSAQVAGASVSGAFSYYQRRQLDMKMGGVLVAGGLCGSVIGSYLFTWLKSLGQIDVVINLFYVVTLGSIGALMLTESLKTLKEKKKGGTRPRKLLHHNRLIAALPMKMRFPRSGVYLSPLAPFFIGLGVGILTIIMGVGGGFVMVPAMIYLLGMAAGIVVGTSLFQIVFVTAAATILHATRSFDVDLPLALLLLVGGVIGAQFGARAARGMQPEKLRLYLAALVLLVAIRLAAGLAIPPAALFSVEVAS